jgi:hypothetical protein
MSQLILPVAGKKWGEILQHIVGHAQWAGNLEFADWAGMERRLLVELGVQFTERPRSPGQALWEDVICKLEKTHGHNPQRWADLTPGNQKFYEALAEEWAKR